MDIYLPKVLVIVIVSYLIGSFPTAFLVAKLRNINIFEYGSGNMGATNVIRAMGLVWGIIVWFFDSLKAVIAIWIASQIMPENHALATVIAAVCAIAGHNWSLFVALITGTIRGGKGAATAFGTLFMIVPFYVIAAMLVVGGFVIALTRYVSLAVLLMFGLAITWMIVLVSQQIISWEYAVYSILLALLIYVRFRENIQRLRAGTERRLGESA
ncbi:MAG TPA: glycerol-3-phosphate acyltransferase [Oceanobacillus sp.]|nr:glycerol-3-phosphate acyltransferase [Oceanobacillus sp.]